MKSEDIFIRRVYSYKGVTVAVDIDLVEKTISLVDKMGDNTFRNKNWVFAERGHEYMPGWLLILEAIQKVIIEASEELAKAERRSEKRFLALMEALSNDQSFWLGQKEKKAVKDD